VHADQKVMDIDFSAPKAKDEVATFTLGGQEGNVQYYRVSRNNDQGTLELTNDYYVFEKDPNNQKRYTWKKYWCNWFDISGTPVGPVLIGEGSIVYP